MGIYIGVKQVKAMAMTKAEYNTYRGWDMPANEDPNEPGFLVEYLDGGKPNDSRHEGYISWSPKDVFDRSYRPVSGMSFGLAIEAAKQGHKIARQGWNGKNMFVVYMPPMQLPPFNTQGTSRKVNDRTAKYIGEDTPLDCQPYFAMFNAQKQWIPGWVASQSDMLSDDWMIVD